jgi:hypothetical protein
VECLAVDVDRRLVAVQLSHVLSRRDLLSQTRTKIGAKMRMYRYMYRHMSRALHVHVHVNLPSRALQMLGRHETVRSTAPPPNQGQRTRGDFTVKGLRNRT